MDNIKRCAWVNINNKEYIHYHDNQWGVSEHDDMKLFDMLCLEGAQAGLSWEIILKKREGYREAFYNFDIEKCSSLSEKDLENLLINKNIIRNKRKILSVKNNAIIFKEIQKEFGTFDNYIWNYVDNKPIINAFSDATKVPKKTSLSEKISKDLKSRKMTFVGPTIIYSYLQSIGIVVDHTVDCFKFKL